MAGSPLVGILALQGDVREHRQVLERLGARVVEVRRPADLGPLDALVIPGGESTVIDKLTRLFGLFEPLREAIAGGLPTYGTCAGMIFLARELVDAAPGQRTLGVLDALVERNAFGPQRESREILIPVAGLGDEPVAAALIRAPRVVEAGEGVEVLARLADGDAVAVRQGHIIASAFHPEISGDTRMHAFLLRIAAGG